MRQPCAPIRDRIQRSSRMVRLETSKKTESKKMSATHIPPTDFQLLLTPREVARTLAISERKLWSLSAPRGPIPVVRCGRAVRYSLDSLRRFVEDQEEKQ